MTDISIVGVPGTLANWRAFAPLFGALKRFGAGHQTFVVDTAHSVTASTATDSALAQIEERSLGKCVVVGFSLGGIIAAHMALKEPDRAVGLILLDMNGEADKPEAASGRRAAVERARELGLSEFVERQLWKTHVATERLSDFTLLREVQLMAEESGVSAFANQMEIAISRPRTIDFLGKLKVPALIFCGSEDVITPPALAKDIASSITGAKLTLIADAGHFAVLERPDVIAETAAPWITSLASL